MCVLFRCTMIAAAVRNLRGFGAQRLRFGVLWGGGICTYKPESNSIGSGQVLQVPYNFEKAKLVVREMTDLLVLDLVDKHLVTDQMVLTIGYDIENLQGNSNYRGEVITDRYGRKTPKHAHGTANLARQTSSTRLITEAVMALYDRIVDPDLLIRRINLTACKVVDENDTAPVGYFL